MKDVDQAGTMPKIRSGVPDGRCEPVEVSNVRPESPGNVWGRSVSARVSPVELVGRDPLAT
eukprot:scaffold418590_cov49-Prasinocladus_malaysianus.AAC.1